MALIDVDPRLFDPARRPDAIIEAGQSVGVTDPDLLAAISDGLAGLFPDPPETMADYHDHLSKYLSVLCVFSGLLILETIPNLEQRVAALEAAND